MSNSWQGPAEPDLDAAFGWAEMAHGAYKEGAENLVMWIST